MEDAYPNRSITRGQVGQGHAFHDKDDGVAGFFHHAADGATGFIGAGTFLVIFFADATDGGKRTLDVTDNLREVDVFWPPSQAITARDPAFAFDEVGGFEVVEDLFEEPFRDVLSFGDFLDTDDRVVFLKVAGQNQQRPERIFTAN